jgi:hypothetical protein
MLKLERALGAGGVWLVPAVGLLDDIVVPVIPADAPPAAAVPHGSPLAPIRLGVPGVVVLPCVPGAGYAEPGDSGAMGLVGDVVVPLLAPTVAPALPPAPPLCARARLVPPGKAMAASRANRFRVCGMRNASYHTSRRAKPTSCETVVPAIVQTPAQMLCRTDATNDARRLTRCVPRVTVLRKRSPLRNFRPPHLLTATSA